MPVWSTECMSGILYLLHHEEALNCTLDTVSIFLALEGWCTVGV